MEARAARSQVTSLLDNQVLSQVERMRINAIRRLTNRSRGEHLSGKGGSSIEFSDYRDYVEGDDIRFVDWNIFSRLHRPYMKLYHQEEEMHVVVVVDASSSMLFEQKLDKAKQIAAAFAVMGLFNAERVSVYVVNRVDKGAPGQLPPCTGRVNMRKVFAFLEAIEGGGDAPLEEGLEAILRDHRGRGVIVLLSDFLTYGDLQRPFNRLFSGGLEIFAVQILGPTEIDPEVTGDLRFVDCETANTLDISAAGSLIGLYQEHLAAYKRKLETLCRQRNGRMLSVSAADATDWLLFDLFRRRGWVV